MIVIGICKHGHNAVQAFYDEYGYKGGFSTEDSILAATDGNRIIGIARLCPEEGVLVLRGMQVASGQQRVGIGSLMLRHLDRLIGERACWGISRDYLEKFYGQIGFRFVDVEKAPPHLRERIQQYRAHNEALNHGKRNCIMFRAAHA